MSREIPFFELFAQLQLSPELRLKLLGAVVVSACIQRESLSMELALTVRHPLDAADLDEMNAAIRRGYGLNDVKIRLTLKEEQPPSQRKAATEQAAGGGAAAGGREPHCLSHLRPHPHQSDPHGGGSGAPSGQLQEKHHGSRHGLRGQRPRRGSSCGCRHCRRQW